MNDERRKLRLRSILLDWASTWNVSLSVILRISYQATSVHIESRIVENHTGSAVASIQEELPILGISHISPTILCILHAFGCVSVLPDCALRCSKPFSKV